MPASSPTPIAVPEDVKSGLSSPPTASSSVSNPLKISTVEAAGPHNAYIWRKLDWYFPWRLAYDPAPMSKTEEPGDLPKRYGRAAFLAIVLGSLALIVTNVILLPLHLLAYGLVVLEVTRSRGHVAKWNPWILQISEFIVGSWQGLVATLLELLGMDVATSGDVLTPDQLGEGALVISNHPSTADWVYLWSFFLRQGDLSKLKIVLKASLHKVPVVGWALQCCRYLFLQRQWERDREHMGVLATHWAGGAARVANKQNEPLNEVQLLLFPEGTDIRPVSYDQSCAFVQKEENQGKLVQFQHVLQPRVTGFVRMIKLLRATGSIKAVYDVTVATTPFPVTIENLTRGIIPQKMHFHLVRYDLSVLPTDEKQLAEWLFKRWNEKDERLDDFYAQPATSPHGRSMKQTPLQLTAQAQQTQNRRLNLQFRQFSLLAGFGFLFFWHLGWCWSHPLLMLLYHSLMIIGWFYIGKKEGGFDSLILSIERKSEEQQQAATIGSPTSTKSPTNAASPSPKSSKKAN